MEPAPEERDDADGHVGLAEAERAAMEPAPEERDDPPVSDTWPAAEQLAAMEPAPEERDDARAATCRASPASSPQWSPLLKSGMTVP